MGKEKSRKPCIYLASGTFPFFLELCDGGGGENRTRVREASAATSTGVG